MASPPSGTVTFLFTDVEGSTRLKAEFPRSERAALSTHEAILRTVIVGHGGFVFNSVGDGLFASFSEPIQAVASAIDAQKALEGHDWSRFDPAFPKLRVRMGVHTGASTYANGNYDGFALNRAARVMSSGHGGQILVSQTTHELLQDLLGSEFTLAFRGEHRLKDLRFSERLYQVVAPGLPEVNLEPRTEGIVTRGKDVSGGPLEQLQAILTGSNVTIPDDLAEEVRRIPPTDFKQYALTRVAEWAGPRFMIDRQFVHLTVLLDRGPNVTVGRWREEPQPYDDLSAVVDRAADPAIVVLGPPGSGKSTLLRRLEYESGKRMLDGLDGPVPVFVSLAQFGETDPPPLEWLEARWRSRYPALPALADMMRSRPLLFLLDGLNEMACSTETGQREAVLAWKRFISDCSHTAPRPRIVVSCRTLDYGAPLSSATVPVPQVRIEPLSDEQIRTFLKRYAPVAWGDLWQSIIDSHQLELFRRPYLLTLLIAQAVVPRGVPAGPAALFTQFVRGSLRREVERDNPLFEPDSLLTGKDVLQLVQNVWKTPYQLPSAGLLLPTITDLAYQMQLARPAGEEANVRVTLQQIARMALPLEPTQLIRASEQLDLLSEDPLEDAVRFRHQLIQEYFAARALEADRVADLVSVPWRFDELEPDFPSLLESLEPAEPIPPAPRSGWDETAKLAAALKSDPDRFLRAVSKVNLALAGECAAMAELRSRVALPLVVDLRDQLLVRTRDAQADPRARVAAALALGRLGHPSLHPAGKVGALVPPLAPIPAGTYPIGSDEGVYAEEAPAHTVQLEAFRMGTFPVTNAEWSVFQQNGGYEDDRWWLTDEAKRWLRGETTGDGAKYNVLIRLDEFRKSPDRLESFLKRGSLTEEHYNLWQSRLAMTADELAEHLAQLFPGMPIRSPRNWHADDFNNPAQPVVGVCWYEARAYCAWLAEQTGTDFRLPTEAEWEATARGSDGRRFAFGDTFDALKCNTVESHWRKPTPVAVHVGGETPEGVFDLTGNVYEWSSSAFARQPYEPVFPYPYDPKDGREDADTSGEILRVMRGGCWAYPQSDARCTVRLTVHPANRQAVDGFRLCVSGH